MFQTTNQISFSPKPNRQVTRSPSDHQPLGAAPPAPRIRCPKDLHSLVEVGVGNVVGSRQEGHGDGGQGDVPGETPGILL